MSRPESLTEHAVRVLAQLATLTDDVNNGQAERHAIRKIKQQAEQVLSTALNVVDGLLYLKTEVRDLVKELTPEPEA